MANLGKMRFTLDDIKRQFDAKSYTLGLAYAQKKKVAQIQRTGNLIRSKVNETANTAYQQNIFIKSTTSGIQFQGTCSCPEVLNCHHVVSVLLSIVRQNELQSREALMNSPLASWVHKLYLAVRPGSPEALAAKAIEHDSPEKLLFVLSPDPMDRRIFMSLCRVRTKRNGLFTGITAVVNLNALLTEKPTYLHDGNIEAVRLFAALCCGIPPSSTLMALPQGHLGGRLIEILMARNELYWANTREDIEKGLFFPLEMSPVREANLFWDVSGTKLRLRWRFVQATGKRRSSGMIDYILPTEPAWYIDNLSSGKLELPGQMAGMTVMGIHEIVAHMPVVPVGNRHIVSRLLAEKGLEDVIPLPEPLQETVYDDVFPDPVLYLGCRPHFYSETEAPVWFDYAQLSFSYDGKIVYYGSNLPVIREAENGGVERIVRDELTEETCVDVLMQAGFRVPLASEYPLRSLPGALALDSSSDWLRFAQETLPSLRSEGWRVIKSPDFRYNLQPIRRWYADVMVHGEDDRDHFSLELGIVVGRRHHPLFPLLVPLLQQFPESFEYEALDGHGKEEALLATLPDKNRVSLPWNVISSILKILGELYYLDSQQTALVMHRLDSARLAELEKAVRLQWINAEPLLDMGRKLLAFNGVSTVTPPASLKATLRDYQVEGLSWMQYLREYSLAGILADDMGLGKTLQILAHILLEKESGRLTAPALIVAPTSLMGNWQDEAERFTPSLNVLLVYGKDRAQRFRAIDSADVVLTTYALLPRDEEELMRHDFHLIILDESQYIKNNRSKAAQVASRLRATHRLCLTGTPLENHLGELWSQFHFLLPGMLGSEKAFNSNFRHAIERSGDKTKQQLLNRRIHPFLLRRTKDRVAKELPMKTEMIRYVDFGMTQRQIYESMRELMDRKVQEEVAKLGIAHCQMIILEALLKLRQVCCDPRLLKGSYRKTNASAKLTELMSMLNELLQENRRILVFSQFTSMLTLIEHELVLRNISYELLTGETVDRVGAVRRFQEGEVRVFLISLKAGGVGLNLTAADTVIHYDPWWNPAVENQATDRAWRIGQDKPVFVYRLIARGTLEEQIQRLQQSKHRLADAMLSSSLGQSEQFQITTEDLKAIFKPMEMPFVPEE